jgi:hypothetical protein
MKNKELLIEYPWGQEGPWSENIPEYIKCLASPVAHHYPDKFPGNYVLEKYYEPLALALRYRIRFHTEQDKIVFLLRYA